MKYNLLIFWTGILGVVLFVGTTVWGGLQFPDYSHLHQFISESYASGTMHGESLRWYGFIPSGFLLAVFAFLYPKILAKSKLLLAAFFGLGIFYGLGTVVTSIFPCDMGCDLKNPSVSQLLHNLMGFLTYLFVPICLIAIGIKTRKWSNYNRFSNLSLIIGFLALLFVGILFAHPDGNLKGLNQRVVEGSILLWISYASIRALKSNNL